MKKHLFAVFAHPDDEAFGPSGTLMLESDSGTILHLVLLTAGQQGINEEDLDDLGSVRLREWHRSGKLLGASSQTHLGYHDGDLSNTTMLEITDRLVKIAQEQASQADEIEFLTFEFGGLTGHIDHIVAARSTAAAFCQLKENDSRIKRLRLFCLPKHLSPTRDYSWIYSSPGLDESEIDETIDARYLRDRIEAVMDCHATQETDAQNVRRQLGDELGMNWFKVVS